MQEQHICAPVHYSAQALMLSFLMISGAQEDPKALLKNHLTSPAEYRYVNKKVVLKFIPGDRKELS
jgi:hypothetical protein